MKYRALSLLCGLALLSSFSFRRLTMADADMQIVDDHPADPLDFSLTRYYDQLVAGYTKNTPNAAPPAPGAREGPEGWRELTARD
jgi:hypothetical protein